MKHFTSMQHRKGFTDPFENWSEEDRAILKRAPAASSFQQQRAEYLKAQATKHKDPAPVLQPPSPRRESIEPSSELRPGQKNPFEQLAETKQQIRELEARMVDTLNNLDKLEEQVRIVEAAIEYRLVNGVQHLDLSNTLAELQTTMFLKREELQVITHEMDQLTIDPNVN